MRLNDLIKDIPVKSIKNGIKEDPEITALVYDSRKIVEGCLFVCIKGIRFDGHDKIGCTIEDNVFIGGNSNIVSSVVLGKDCYIAAGSTITSDVPALSLGIGRSKQLNKENWVADKSRMRGENYIRLDDRRSEV
jgi:NDP-sugar pyrophosphorylase family protein